MMKVIVSVHPPGFTGVLAEILSFTLPDLLIL